MLAASQSDRGVPVSTNVHPLPQNIVLRPATTVDVHGMADCFFNSFTPSHLFWSLEWPEPVFRPWWLDAWKMGIEDDNTMRSFVAVDTDAKETKKNTEDGRIVGFTRWRVPQQDGNLNELWPDLPSERIDMNIMGAFFGGMHKNRTELINGRPHWFLQLLGTETSYQGLGIGEAFVKWGCDRADEDDLEVYIDASMKGAPFYQQHFGTVPKAIIPIPEKPETFGKFTYMSHVRPKKSDRGANGSEE